MAQPVPLVFRVAADLKEFRANLAELKQQLETTRSSMTRMSSAFDGSRLIADANAAVVAVDKLGGAAKLTAGEKARLNRTLTDALAKYQALGREAPQAMRDLAEATKKIEPPLTMAGRALDVLKSSFGQFTAANLASDAIGRATSSLGEFAAQGMKLPGLQASFANLTRGIGQDGQAMLAGMSTATRGLVSNYDLLTSANKAMLLGLPVTSQSMGELTRSAVTLGRAMGQDATKSVDDLITALGRSAPQILDNLGLSVKLGEANEAYAAKLRTSVDQLTDADRKMAFYEATLEAARRKTAELGEQTLTLGEVSQSVWTAIGNRVSESVSVTNQGLGAMIVEFRRFMATREEAAAWRPPARGGDAEWIAEVTAGVKAATAELTSFHGSIISAIPGGQAFVMQLRLHADAARKAADAQADLNSLIAKARELAPKLPTNTGREGQFGVFNPRDIINADVEAGERAKRAAEAYAAALRAIRDAQVPLTVAQRAQIESLVQLGIGYDTIAKALRVSEVAVRNFVQAQKENREQAAKDLKAERDRWESARQMWSDMTRAREQAARGEATVRSEVTNQALALWREFEEKNTQATLTGTALRIRQIEREREAQRGKLDMLRLLFGEQNWLYQTASAAIEAFYQRQIAMANGTAPIIDRLRAVGIKTQAELNEAASRAKQDYEDAKKAADQLGDAAVRAAKRAKEAAEEAARGYKTLRQSLLEALEQIPDVIVSALTGGGGIRGAAEAVGSMVGRAIGESIGRSLAGEVGGKIGAAIGSLLGPLAGVIVGALDRNKGRDAVRRFIDESFQGSFDLLRARLESLGPAGQQLWVSLTQGVGRNNPEQARRAIEAITEALARADELIARYNISWRELGAEQRLSRVREGAEALFRDLSFLTVQLGVSQASAVRGMAAELNAYLAQALAAGVKIPAGMGPILESLIRQGLLTDENRRKLLGMSEAAMPAFADVKAAADLLGLSIQGIGEKVSNLEFAERVSAMAEALRTVEAAGADMAAVFAQAVPKIQPLVTEALKYGKEMPEAMRPFLQRMVDAGLLTDESGNKLKDLSRIKFAEPLTEKVDDLIEKLNELIEVIKKGVGGALDDIGKRVVRPRIEPEYIPPDGSGRPGPLPGGGGGGGEPAPATSLMASALFVRPAAAPGVAAPIASGPGMVNVTVMMPDGDVLLRQVVKAGKRRRYA